MAAITGNLTSEGLGELLRSARENAKLTQAAAADALDVARTTLVAIEQGQRRARLDELQKLAALYRVSLNVLLRQDAANVDLRPRFRRGGNADQDVEAAAGLLNNLVQAELELENLLGIRRVRNDPPERPLLPGNVLVQAEQDAAELRNWLGLGVGPVHDILSILEVQLGARVFVRKLPARVSGLYAFDANAGACVLLNAAHPHTRRAQTAAHELGHFISTRSVPDALFTDFVENNREERYANAFARCFLTPARAVAARFAEITAGASHLTRRHVIILAHAFNVSREAMVRRLEELGLTRSGTWDWFQSKGRITDEQAREVLGVEAAQREASDVERLVSLRMGLMASEAWRRGLVSEGQLARLLHIDRVEARELIDEFSEEGAADDESPRLLP